MFSENYADALIQKETGRKFPLRLSESSFTEVISSENACVFSDFTINLQDINRQIRELKAAGADEVIFEYEHGNAKVKKNHYMLLETEAGDTIITIEFSRLSCSTQRFCEILDIVKHNTFGW